MSSSDMITVSVKLMNGEILLIEFDPTTSIAGLKHKIQEYDEQFSLPLQVLIRLSDEETNPSDICDGDSFLLLINPDQVKFRFYDESLVEPVAFVPQEGSSNDHHHFEIYSLYNTFQRTFYYFIYDTDSNQYAIADSCDVYDGDDEYDELETYYFTDDTIWYSSLYECLQSYYTNIFPEGHHVIDQLDVRFKKFRVDNEFSYQQ